MVMNNKTFKMKYLRCWAIYNFVIICRFSIKETPNSFHHYIIYFFRSPSRDSDDQKALPEENGRKGNRIGSSHVEKGAYERDLDEDNFLAHLETDINCDGSFLPQR